MRLVLFCHTVQDEALHGKRLAMIGILFQDRIGLFDGLLVLLLLVIFDDILEEVKLLFGQRSSLTGLWVVRVVCGRHNWKPNQ